MPAVLLLLRISASTVGQSWHSATRSQISELSSAKRLDFCAAGHSEFAQQIDRSAVDHVAQLEEALVRCQILFRSICSALSRTQGEDMIRILPNVA
jgi:hypothetical protein